MEEAAARSLTPEKYLDFFAAVATWRERAKEGLMSYLKASGEQLTELRKMTLWELYESFEIVKMQDDQRKAALERRNLLRRTR